MANVYYSHSYREQDEEVNSYFLDLFADHSVCLVHDPQSEVWCVPKLEKHANNCHGMVAIIPRRESDAGAPTFSPYLNFELQMARRARIPLLAFVDDWMLVRLEGEFPPNAIPFDFQRPEIDKSHHEDAIAAFCETVERASTSYSPKPDPRLVSVFLGESAVRASLDQSLIEILTRNGYNAKRYGPDVYANCREDLSVIDRVATSAASVFCMEGDLTRVDVAMCTAYTLCRPAFRIQYTIESKTCQPTVGGTICWRQLDKLLPVFEEQVQSFKLGCIETALTPNPGDLLFRLDKLQPQFLLDRLMRNVHMPAEFQPPAQKTHAERCHEFVQWAESPTGCGLAKLQLRLQESFYRTV